MSVAKVEFAEKHGTAEAIRYLIHYGGEKLDSLKDYIEDWFKNLEEGRIDVHHAVAVARCLGTAIGLNAKDHWIDAHLDTIALIIYEILKNVEEWYKETDKKKKMEMLKEIKNNILDDYLSSFEKIVKDNGGHFYKELTWLDFFFAGAIEILEYYLGFSVLDGIYPSLMKLAKQIWDMPEIKEYIKNRKFKN